MDSRTDQPSNQTCCFFFGWYIIHKPFVDSERASNVQWKGRSKDELAELICGNVETAKGLFPYRSSSYITRFFWEVDTDYSHDGSTRAAWVSDTLGKILDEPHPDARTPPDTFQRLIRVLMDRHDATPADTPDRKGALARLNLTLNREGFEAFYADDNQCYLRHIGSNTVVAQTANPHRPFSRSEQMRKEQLSAYLDKISEDKLTDDVLLPLLRQLGFHRITSAGHKDKALEYGKDIWMRYVLPTQHVIYFGIQAKKGKLDAAGMSKGTNANVAEILTQAQMMLAHEIFDPELNRRVLVDHVFIVAGVR